MALFATTFLPTPTLVRVRSGDRIINQDFYIDSPIDLTGVTDVLIRNCRVFTKKYFDGPVLFFGEDTQDIRIESCYFGPESGLITVRAEQEKQ